MSHDTDQLIYYFTVRCSLGLGVCAVGGRQRRCLVAWLVMCVVKDDEDTVWQLECFFVNYAANFFRVD